MFLHALGHRLEHCIGNGCVVPIRKALVMARLSIGHTRRGRPDVTASASGTRRAAPRRSTHGPCLNETSEVDHPRCASSQDAPRYSRICSISSELAVHQIPWHSENNRILCPRNRPAAIAATGICVRSSLPHAGQLTGNRIVGSFKAPPSLFGL